VIVGQYVPARGDYIAVSLDPQSGHEQRGRRPALVVSNDLFNKHTGLCIICPITTRSRDFPFHVALPAEAKVNGFVMVEQVKSVDFRSWGAKHMGQASEQVLQETLALLDACMF
jgi:mRNA interferase MazF